MYESWNQFSEFVTGENKQTSHHSRFLIQFASGHIKVADLDLCHTRIGDLNLCSMGLSEVKNLVTCYYVAQTAGLHVKTQHMDGTG
jgi:hypothetical protein